MAGYRELWGRLPGKEWEHIDTANADNPEGKLRLEYQAAFGDGWEFQWR